LIGNDVICYGEIVRTDTLVWYWIQDFGFGFALRIWIRFRIWISAFSLAQFFGFGSRFRISDYVFFWDFASWLATSSSYRLAYGFEILASTDFGFDFPDFVYLLRLSSISRSGKNAIKKPQEQKQSTRTRGKKNKKEKKEKIE
jgi:hypothetical protein